MDGPDQRFWKLKRIPEGGETHLRSLERKRENPTHRVFGERSIEEFLEHQRRAAADPTYAETAPDLIWPALDKRDIISFFERGNAEQRGEIKELIDEALGDSASLAVLRGMSSDEITDAASVVASLKKPDVPVEFVVTLLGAHKAKYEERNEQVWSLGERLKEEFFIAVQSAIARGFLSPDTDIGLVRARLEATQFFYIDPASGGSHASVSRSNEGLIGISKESMMEDTEDMRRHVFFHELVHATLAGRQITASVVKEYDQVMTHDNRKEGLRFDFERAPNGRKEGWMMGLNEGVTEYIAQHLSGVTNSVAYGVQILYITEMVKKGVPMSEFIHAYQEDYKLGTKGEQRLPRLAKLLGSIRAAMGEEWYNKQIRQLKFDYGWGL